jgi:hypothetical protein
VRAQALAAAQGAGDFGEYFLAFSAFLLVAALLLAGLFFRLGVEQRAREVGLLRALGWTATARAAPADGEGLALAVAGALLGVAGAVAFAWLVLLGLRTVWVDAVGLRTLHLACRRGVASAAAAAPSSPRRRQHPARPARAAPCQPAGAARGRRRTGRDGRPAGRSGRRRAGLLLAAALVAASARGRLPAAGGSSARASACSAGRWRSCAPPHASGERAPRASAPGLRNASWRPAAACSWSR